VRIAIVGATGMLGHHTAVAALRAGHEVIVVYRNPRSLEAIPDVQFDARQADLNDRLALRNAFIGADSVINCAGYYPTIPRPWRDEVQIAKAQMQNFYDACADLPLRKIVYLGAAIALPRNSNGRPGNEELRYREQPNKKSPYLQVKWALDEQGLTRAQEGLPITIGIPTMTFGEFDPGNTTGRLIIELANRSMPGYVNGRRNVIYAGDAGRGLVRVCEAGRAGERYLLAGENLTMKELMGKVAVAVGAPMPKAIPLNVARLVSAWQTFRFKLGGPEPQVSDSAIAVMSSGQFINGEKARQQLGFYPEVSIDKAIARALKWFRGRGLVKPSYMSVP
jgi:dihydroflavonol-4-reductase